MGNDVVHRGKGSVCIGIGDSSNMFHVSRGNEQQGGLLGMVADDVLAQLSEHAVCTLSIMEIVQEGVLRDLLVVPGRATFKVTIRHDHRGAVVNGMTDMPLDSITGLKVSDMFVFVLFIVACT
jgi:hypothetical protein